MFSLLHGLSIANQSIGISMKSINHLCFSVQLTDCEQLKLFDRACEEI